METALMAAKELLYRKLSRLQIASFLRNMNMVLGAKSDSYQAVLLSGTVLFPWL
jgi:hypothetical protein